MSMIEYNTLNYIMYKEAMAKIAQQEAEEQAARDDEVSKQKAYGSGSESLSVLTDEQKAVYDAAQNLSTSVSGLTEADLQQVLEEEGLI